MTHIYHITRLQDWQAALDNRAYRTPTLSQEGFIHCSTESQVLRVANAFYRGQSGLVILVIETDKLTVPLKVEPPINPQTGQQETDVKGQFPHVYGAINLDAVIRIVDFPSSADGTFILPEI